MPLKCNIFKIIINHLKYYLFYFFKDCYMWHTTWGECVMDSNACYSCGKPGHMMKDSPNRRSQEQGKERV